MKRSKLTILVVSGILAAAVAVQAQEKKAPEKKAAAPAMPKPGPEVKKLGYFVGKWTSEGEVKANPMMPAGKMTSADTCAWYAGGYHVVCNSKGAGPMGKMSGLGILGYNTEEKVYTYNGIDNTGHLDMARGTTDGKTWNYTSEEKMGGKTMYGRYSMSDITPDSYTFKWDMSEDNKTWTNVMEGKTTRVPKADAAKK